MLARSLNMKHKYMSSIFKDNVASVELVEIDNGSCNMKVYLRDNNVKQYEFKSFIFVLKHIMNTRVYHSGLVVVYNKDKNLVNYNIM